MQSGRERPPSTTCLSVRTAARRVAHVPDALRLRHQIVRAAGARVVLLFAQAKGGHHAFDSGAALGAVRDRAADVERRVKAIQQKLDRLDEAFLYAQSIDQTSDERQRDRLREELTLAQIDRHAEAIEEVDVEGVLAFAERVLPRAADLWVQASADQKQRLQQLFFPDGIVLVSRIFVCWNQLDGWLRQIDGLRRAA